MLYTNEKTKNISFPLGGIGTGCIGLAGNGELVDWEIFNRPNKNTRNGFSHFAIRARSGGKTTVKVLHGDTHESLMGRSCRSDSFYGFGFGPLDTSLAGFPHFRDVSFEGHFPLARMTFSEDGFPAVVRLLAFNPMIPHEELDSSLPLAFFAWEIENVSSETVDFALSAAVRNPSDHAINRSVRDGALSGVLFSSGDKNQNEVGYSDLCLLTDAEDTDVEAYWYRSLYFFHKDHITTYWKNLSELDRMPERHYDTPGAYDHGCTVAHLTLAPGERRTVRFVLAWNVPLAVNYWTEGRYGESFRNYYATEFSDSLATARYGMAKFDDLYARTLRFADALAACTLPDAVRDAVSANLSVLKTPTVWRMTDGSLWGWEGSMETHGSCCGSCQHVWNYAYAVPFLFPRLERSLRENTVKYGLMDSGATSFRLDLPLRREMYTDFACLDGQMGEVIKWYREWKLSGDDAWLRAHAEAVFSMLEYAWSEENPDCWDRDRDGILEGRQHNTLDNEVFGPGSWLEGMYLLALAAGAEMADALGQGARAEEYRRLFEQGRAFLNTALFNGRYYYHKVDLTDRTQPARYGVEGVYWNEEAGEIKYQVAEGCLIDQMLAEWHAHLVGMPRIYDPEKKRIALHSLYQNNYKPSMREVTNMWRNFALNDESGTVMCTFPEGARTPVIPMMYCEETMTGFEYALAGLMIAEGLCDMGETLVRAVRDRYDGEKRNPYNEIECGSNYARSMASFALLPIYSGFTYDMTRAHIGFAPLSGAGTYLFSVKDSWGTFSLTPERATLTMCGNPLTLRSLSLPNADRITAVTVDDRTIPFTVTDAEIHFQPTEIKEVMCIAYHALFQVQDLRLRVKILKFKLY